MNNFQIETHNQHGRILRILQIPLLISCLVSTGTLNNWALVATLLVVAACLYYYTKIRSAESGARKHLIDDFPKFHDRFYTEGRSSKGVTSYFLDKVENRVKGVRWLSYSLSDIKKESEHLKGEEIQYFTDYCTKATNILAAKALIEDLNSSGWVFVNAIALLLAILGNLLGPQFLIEFATQLGNQPIYLDL